MIVTVALVLLLDQLTKFLLSKSLYPGQSIPIIKNIFHITLILNTGAAFGIFPNATFFFIIISIFVIVLITHYTLHITLSAGRQAHYTKIKIPLALILAGAIGNLIDRLKFGYVTDFLDFRIWPVFNIADSAITIGAIWLACSVLRKSKNKLSNS
jgi:signal peptidase II